MPARRIVAGKPGGDMKTAITLRTPLCHELGIEYPVFSAGIGTAAVPELVAAVSGAGGFGVLGASPLDPTRIKDAIADIRRRTERPFGANLIIDDRDLSTEDREELRQQLAAAAEAHVAVIVLFWGDPAPYIKPAHERGVRVFIQVGSVEEAEAAAAAGVDAVIAQGVEAGGHVRGRASIWDLLPVTVKAISPLPVLASGGIGDGAGLARALTLGAQGVSLGTRFVASDEAWAHPAYKRRVVESAAADTVYNELYDVWRPNAPHRTLRNRTLLECEAAGRPAAGARPGEGASIGPRPTADGQVRDWPRDAIGVAAPDFADYNEDPPLRAGSTTQRRWPPETRSLRG